VFWRLYFPRHLICVSGACTFREHACGSLWLLRRLSILGAEERRKAARAKVTEHQTKAAQRIQGAAKQKYVVPR
jgi:hypothetical protein